MRNLFLILAGLLSLLLIAPAALAQQTPTPQTPPTAQQAQPIATETPAETAEPTEASEAAEGAQEAEPIPEPPPEPPVPVSVRDNTLLKKEKTFEAIQLGDDPSLVALYQPSAQGETRGLLVILHPAVAPSGLPNTLESLRRHLPASGWASLAFAIPDNLPPAAPAGDPRPQPAPAPVSDTEETPVGDEVASETESGEETTPPAAEATPETTDAAEEETSTETTNGTAEAPLAAEIAVEEEPTISPEAARAETLQLRLAALTGWLQQQEGVSPILVIENHHASEILPLLTRQLMMQQQTLRALVLLNTSPADTRSPTERDAFFRDYTLPVLDVFLQPETSRTREIRRWQQASAKRQKHPAYRQLLLTAPAFTERDEERHYWVERIRGFLTRLPAANSNGQAQ
jgi:hypothetical protein